MQFLVWISFNVFRPISATFIGFFARIKWVIKAIKYKEVFKANKAKWEQIESLENLIKFFKKDYTYKYDLGKGFWDHDSSIYEWCLAYGDCDDAALYSMKKLKKLGYKASRYGMWGKGLCHFDTLYEKDGKICLFNYGSCIIGDSKEEVFKELFRRYRVNKVWYCKVWY